MTRTILFTAALGSAAALFALGANAQTAQMPQAAPAQQQMSIAEIATMLEGQGYTVREIERERRAYEVEIIDANGMRIEAYLDPVTGAVLRGYDDDHDRRGGRDDDDRAGYRSHDRDGDHRHGRDDD